MSRAGAILLVFLVCGAVVEADVVKPYPINFTIPVRNVVTNVNATKMADYIEKKIKAEIDFYNKAIDEAVAELNQHHRGDKKLYLKYKLVLNERV